MIHRKKEKEYNENVSYMAWFTFTQHNVFVRIMLESRLTMQAPNLHLIITC